jgi:hypothetical protein
VVADAARESPREKSSKLTTRTEGTDVAERSEADAREHADLIKAMAAHLAAQGYTEIKADVEGFDAPASVMTPRGEFTPDLTCLSTGKFRRHIVVEVETCRTIFDPHTVDEWEVFGREARIHAGEFHVAVPRRCGIESGQDLVKRRISQLGFHFRPHLIWEV